MKFAYADPPYLGCGSKHYAKHHEDAASWDDEQTHRDLLRRLLDEFPDGWALSLSTPSLQWYLATLEETGLDQRRGDFRVGPWIKPFASFKPGIGVAYAWEPVIWCGGRKRTREQNTTRDWVSANITMQTGLPGAKPEQFCFWLFEVLNIQRGDTLADLFPGTGIVGRALVDWLALADWRADALTTTLKQQAEMP